MSDAFVGEIRLVGFNFAPVGWALCNGQLLPISQNTALFSLLGTSFGGNGVSNFALPDLRGRVPLHMGQGPESNYTLGDWGGNEAVTLNLQQIPSHNHTLAASDALGTQSTPKNNYISAVGRLGGFSATANVTMAPQEVGSSGEGQSHTNIQPYLTLNFIIALQGIFPPRNE